MVGVDHDISVRWFAMEGQESQSPMAQVLEGLYRPAGRDRIPEDQWIAYKTVYQVIGDMRGKPIEPARPSLCGKIPMRFSVHPFVISGIEPETNGELRRGGRKETVTLVAFPTRRFLIVETSERKGRGKEEKKSTLLSLDDLIDAVGFDEPELIKMERELLVRSIQETALQSRQHH